MIAWFARNSVAANLLMVFIILMGANGIVNRTWIKNGTTGLLQLASLAVLQPPT